MRQISLAYALTGALLAAGCNGALHGLPPLEAPNDTGGGRCPAEQVPSDLTATVAEDSVTLAWTDNSGGTLDFVVQRAKDGGAFGDITNRLPEATYVDTEASSGLETDAAYSYRVRAESATCESEHSETAEALTWPDAPDLLSASPNADGDIVLSWEDDNDYETGFRVELVDAQDAVVETLATLEPVAGVQASFTDEGPHTGDTLRRYRVVAINDSGEASTTTQTMTLPNAPGNLMANIEVFEGAGYIVSVSWMDTNENETDYRIEWNTSSPIDLDPDSTAYTINEVAGGSTLSVTVTAVNDAGNVSADVTLTLPPSPPSQFEAAPVDADTIAISWEFDAADTTLLSFVLERSLADAGAWASLIGTVTDTNTTEHTDAPPLGATEFDYRLVITGPGGTTTSDPIRTRTHRPPSFPDPFLTLDETSATCNVSVDLNVEYDSAFNLSDDNQATTGINDVGQGTPSVTTTPGVDGVGLSFDTAFLGREFQLIWGMTDTAGNEGEFRALISLDIDGDALLTDPNDVRGAVAHPGQQPYDPPATDGVDCDIACGGVRASISVGANHTCTIAPDGVVHCWGPDAGGVLGNGIGTTDQAIPGPVIHQGDGMDQRADVVRAGFDNVCALQGGDLYCWGAGAIGVTGAREASPQSPILSNVTAFDTTDQGLACAVSGGIARCWGDNSNGELGDPNAPASSDSPWYVCSGNNADCDASNNPLSGVRSIAAAGDFACALMDDTTVQCWGRNDVGQLGRGNAAGGAHAYKESVVCGGLSGNGTYCEGGALRGVVQIAASGQTACALLDNGQPWCWGSRTGRVMDAFETTGNASVPTYVCDDNQCTGQLQEIVQITRGGGLTCGLQATGGALCWGGLFGDLGAGPHVFCEDGFAPGCAVPLTDVIAIDSGTSLVCAVREGGDILCAGANNSSQLGNGETAAGFNTGTTCASGAGDACPPFEATRRQCGAVLPSLEVLP
jgi:alpha-tubulin suppressor-like RCC1 family protein